MDNMDNFQFIGGFHLYGEIPLDKCSLDRTWTLDNEDFVGDGSGAWYGDEGVSTRAVLSALTAKAFPAPGTYGPYTITGVAYDDSPYTVSFSAAKVEQKTVQVRECDDIGDGYSPYENETAILVTIRSGTEVMVSGGDDCGVPVQVGYYDGNNQYTKSVFGVAQYIHNGIGKKSFEWDFDTRLCPA